MPFFIILLVKIFLWFLFNLLPTPLPTFIYQPIHLFMTTEKHKYRIFSVSSLFFLFYWCHITWSTIFKNLANWTRWLQMISTDIFTFIQSLSSLDLSYSQVLTCYLCKPCIQWLINNKLKQFACPQIHVLLSFKYISQKFKNIYPITLTQLLRLFKK